MTITTDPSVSFFISKVRSAKKQAQASIILNELKNMAAKDEQDVNVAAKHLWKKLYILTLGIDNNIFDFIKACGSTSLLVKRLGYQGLCIGNSQKYLFLLQNILQKDLEDQRIVLDALTFLSNINDDKKVLGDIISRIQVDQQRINVYSRYLVVKCKYEDTPFFSVISSNEKLLFLKLQLILDQKLYNNIEEADVSWLKTKLSKTKCSFIKMKILQLFQQLHTISKITIDDPLCRQLKGLLIQNTEKSKKQIEIAIAIESIKLLVLAKQARDRVEEFIFRLISSKHNNSRFIGFKCAKAFKIIPEVVISKIFELGIDKKLYHNTLLSLINQTTFKTIYQKLMAMKKKILDLEITQGAQSELFLKLLERICEFGDQEFIYKILLDSPELYDFVSHRNLIVKEQCKEFFKLILKQETIKHFPMIYDLFPTKIKSLDTTAELGKKHLAILVNNIKVNNIEYFHMLVDFLCMHGDPELNRGYLLETLKKEFSRVSVENEQPCNFTEYQNLQDLLFCGIEAFNIVSIADMLLYVGRRTFMKYRINNEKLTIELPNNCEILSVKGKNPVVDFLEIDSTIKDGVLIRTYSYAGSGSVEFEVMNNHFVTKRSIRVFSGCKK
ncbi:hypothetical protein GINT2_000104 [Glugoides intestinalis]